MTSKELVVTVAAATLPHKFDQAFECVIVLGTTTTLPESSRKLEARAARSSRLVSCEPYACGYGSCVYSCRLKSRVVPLEAGGLHIYRQA